MSKLDDLLKQYCPDGVEYKRLGDIGNFYGGLSGKSKDDFGKGDNYYVTYLNVFSNLEVDLEKCEKVKISKNERQNALSLGDVIFTGSSETPDECGISSVVTKHPEFPVYLNSFCFFLRLSNSNLMIPEYAKYVFRASETRKKIIKTASGVTRFNVSKKKMEEVTIPIPPLAVQEVIANILDSFTKLTAELTAELTARRAQYEYYRDKLLTFDDETAIVKRIKDMLDQTCGGAEKVEYKSLSEIFDFKNGYTPSKSNPEFWENGTIPWFRLEDIRENGRVLNDAIQHVSSEASKGDVFPADSFIVSTSATIGEHAWITVPFLANQRFTCLTCKSEWKSKLDLKYIYYVLFNLDKWCKENIRVGNFASVDMSGFAKWRFPVPPKAVQEEIARILDKFNTLTTDITTGLPAEISLRQKQYEHYRDRLLNFNGGGIT